MDFISPVSLEWNHTSMAIPEPPDQGDLIGGAQAVLCDPQYLIIYFFSNYIYIYYKLN